MADQGVYEVYAIKYAEQTERIRSDNFIFDDNPGAPHPIDYFVWVIRNEARTILVDSGFDGRESISRDRPILIEPRDAVAEIGIAPDTIETVIVTHLHFDHAGGLAQFAGARLHLQEAEMAYATGRCMCHDTMRGPFTGEHICEAVKRLYNGLVTFHDGDAEIAPGISVHLIGGHSSGLQVVRVQTAHGPVVLASDASHYYENYEARKPFVIVSDLEKMLAGFDRLRQLAGPHGRIIPGHDPLVLERFPQAFAGAAADIRRLDGPEDLLS